MFHQKNPKNHWKDIGMDQIKQEVKKMLYEILEKHNITKYQIYDFLYIDAYQ